MTNDDWRDAISQMEDDYEKEIKSLTAERDRLRQRLVTLEYVLRKDSLCDSERVSSALQLVRETLKGAN